MQFNLKCRFTRQEQLNKMFLSCGMLRCVGWQLVTDVSGRYMFHLQDSSFPGKILDFYNLEIGQITCSETLVTN
jgi:hypothetical protein